MRCICFCDDTEKNLVQSKIAVQYPKLNFVPKSQARGCASLSVDDVSVWNDDENASCFNQSKVDGIEHIEEETNDNLPIQFQVNDTILGSATQKTKVDGKEVTRSVVSGRQVDLSILARSISGKLSSTCMSSKGPKKKRVRFDDNVTIYTIECNNSKTVSAEYETHQLVGLLREIWSKLDVDRDGYLSMWELKCFCSEVWDVFDLSNVMSSYAKSNPSKGMDFHEWCGLVQEEQPDMEEFVEDLYEIFVESSGLESDAEEVH